MDVTRGGFRCGLRYLFSLPILSSLPGDGRARAGVISESGHTGADESSA